MSDLTCKVRNASFLVLQVMDLHVALTRGSKKSPGMGLCAHIKSFHLKHVFLSDGTDCEAQAMIWKKICVLMWVLVRLRNVVSESRDKGLRAEKAGGGGSPNLRGALQHSCGTVLTSVETRYVGRCGTVTGTVRGWVQELQGRELRPQQCKPIMVVMATAHSRPLTKDSWKLSFWG